MRSAHRVAGWERILARAAVFGFVVDDRGSDMVEVVRDGRTCGIDLVGTVHISAKDPRDVWLLKQVVEDGSQWECVEVYFFKRLEDGETMPVELRLGRHSDDARTPFLDHDSLDGCLERTTLRDVEALHAVLPPLAPTNAVGYHFARERIVATYERIRPKTWTDIGISDPALIAEYENYYVSADHVAHARESGHENKDEIIAAYGLPPLQWVDDDHRSDQ
jgi:hypothetical protein